MTAGSWLFTSALGGLADLGLGGLWAVATGAGIHHWRRCRVVDLDAVRDGPREGLALLGGIVESADDEQPGPVLWAGLSAHAGQEQSLGARAFTLRLPSGTAVRIEPHDGAWSLDTTFVPTQRDGRCVYEARVQPGDEVYVSGALQRSHDPRAAGTGYRDASRAWVLRGALSFSSAVVVAAHAARFRFHRRWAVLFGVSLALLELGRWVSVRAGLPFDAARPFLVAGVACVAAVYWFYAEATTPWIRRHVRVRGAWLR